MDLENLFARGYKWTIPLAVGNNGHCWPDGLILDKILDDKIIAIVETAS